MSFSGILTIGLYVSYVLVADNVPRNGLMALTAPFVVAGLWRYWRCAHAHPEVDADEVLLRDPILVAVVAGFVLVSVAVLAWG